MHSSITPRFRQTFGQLSAEVRLRVAKAYRLWRSDPFHPSLHFKKIGAIWSARIDYNYRTLAYVVDDTTYWFWVGSHADYDRLLKLHRKN